MKDDNSYFYFAHGDGSTAIYVRITNSEVIQYCDIFYHPVGSILTGRWYLLEFRNIDWVADTYDIYLNGISIKSGARMLPWPSASGIARFSNTYPGIGSFWIDDINDSLRLL